MTMQQPIVGSNTHGITSMLQSALDLNQQGWLIFPLHDVVGGGCSCTSPQCRSPGKHPRTSHGHKEATRDRARVAQWWSEWPNAGIATPTGKLAGIWVLDVDPRHGGDASLAALVENYEALPGTLRVRTGGGGLHIYFTLPPGDHKWRKGIGRGLDVKAEGGYVVLPPTLHLSGRRYEWLPVGT